MEQVSVDDGKIESPGFFFFIQPLHHFVMGGSEIGLGLTINVRRKRGRNAASLCCGAGSSKVPGSKRLEHIALR